MADFGSPVAQNVNVNPNQGIQTLSGLLGVKQQQQALQTGAIQQQGLAADVQQKQQQNQELQQAQGLLRQVHQGGYRDKNGNLDAQKLSQDLASIGPYAGQTATNVINMGNDIVTNQKAVQGLTEETRGQIGNVIGSLASNPATKARDVTDAVTDWIADHANDPNAVRVGKGLLHTVTMLQDGPQLRGALSNISGELSGKPQSAPSTVDNGGVIQPGQTMAATGEFIPAGAAIKKPPESVPGPGGQLLNRNPQTGALSVPPGSNTPMANGSSAPPSKLPSMQRPGVNAPAADQANYNARVQQLGQEYQAVSTTTNDPINGVQSTRFRNQQILDLIPHAETGPGMRMLNTLASRLPGASGDAYQDLEHYLSQNSAAMAKTMGVPSTNLGAETAAAAAGNVERNPGALREITRTNDALNTAVDLYNRGFAKVTNNGSDMSRAASYKQAFGQNVDINAIRWADAHRRKDQEEIVDLSKKLGPEGIKAAQQKLRVLKSLSDNGDLP